MKRADRTKRERAANAAIFIAMIFICVVLLIPYIFMLNSSLKPTASKVFVYDPWIAGGRVLKIMRTYSRIGTFSCC